MFTEPQGGIAKQRRGLQRKASILDAVLDEAKSRFERLKLDNMVSRHGDGFVGWPEQAPFDLIVLSCAVPEVPQTLTEQLKLGGVLIAPVGNVPKSNAFGLPESFSPQLTKLMRTATGLTVEKLLSVVFVPMLSGLP